jgi:hypothetical protein
MAYEFQVTCTKDDAGVETHKVMRCMICSGNFATKQEADLYAAALEAMQALPQGHPARDRLNIATARFREHRSFILGRAIRPAKWGEVQP